MVKNSADTFSRFDTISLCFEQTVMRRLSREGQTQGHNCYTGIALCIAAHAAAR